MLVNRTIIKNLADICQKEQRRQLINYEQRRRYFFLPTGLVELSHRLKLLFNEAKKRQVTVRLLKDRLQESANFKFRRQRLRSRRWIRKQQVRMKSISLRDRARQAAAAAGFDGGTNGSFTNQTITLTEYSQPDWFHPVDGRPLTSRDPSGRFVNPWSSTSTNGIHSATKILRWRTIRFLRQIRELGWRQLIPSVHLKDPMKGRALEAFSTSKKIWHTPKNKPHKLKRDTKCIGLQWIGHSTCLVEMVEGGLTILTDPIFSHRASPIQSLPVGVARDIPPPVSASQLPPIDICLISHDHYDHLDERSVLKLREKVQWWIVPLGIKEWLETSCHIPADKIVELQWWESVRMEKKLDKWIFHGVESDKIPEIRNEDVHGTNLTITCCPTQHWSSRSFFDRNKRLWCSFAVATTTPTVSSKMLHLQKQKFYFGGDSGLPLNQFPLFQQIGDFCGGHFDLAAIPIGAYEPSFFMQDSHMNPAEAVVAAKALGAQTSVGIHWGSFALTEEGIDDPPKRLEMALQDHPDVDFITIPIGATLEVPCDDFDDTYVFQSKGSRNVAA